MELDSRITEVTVYEDQALVTRRTRATLAPGTHHVRLRNLPMRLLPDSVRVRAEGTGRATLHGFDLKTVYTGQGSSERAEAIAGMRRALEDEQRQNQDAEAIQQSQLQALQATTQQLAAGFTHQVSEGRAKTGEWADVLGFLESSQQRAHERLLELDRQARELDRRFEALAAEERKLHSLRAVESLEAVAVVEVTEEANLSFTVEYVVAGASWSPLYEARLLPEGDRLTWRYGAMVRQETGEHWEDVKLRLSTAQPALGGSPPALPDWTLLVWKPTPAAAAMPMRKMSMSASDDEEAFGEAIMASVAPPPAPAPEAAMAIRHHGTSVTLEVPRPITVPSHGEPHHAPVGEADFPPRLSYRTVPKLAPHAYLEVDTTHTGPWPILAGPVKAFLGQDYVGTSHLEDDLQPGQTFTLSMGADRAIRIGRKRLVRKAGESGLIQKQRVHDYQFEVTAANHKAGPQKLTIVEPVPQSGREDLKIKLGELSMPARQDEPGRLSWEIELAPGEEKTIRWGYKVEYPVGLEVMGLE